MVVILLNAKVFGGISMAVFSTGFRDTIALGALLTLKGGNILLEATWVNIDSFVLQLADILGKMFNGTDDTRTTGLGNG